MTATEQRVRDLEQLAVLARTLPAPHGPRLADAIREHLDSGRSLDGSMGLTATEFERVARARRDAHLRDAAEHVAGDTLKARAAALAREIARFTDARGRRDRDRSRVPDAQPARSLALADRVGALPLSARHLLRILTSGDTGRACNVTGDCGMVGARGDNSM